ncbi:MAG: thioredoxin family protein [Pirellulales bacterium]|nr:thioredoxin family protein [Pirellulales bacterium]
MRKIFLPLATFALLSGLTMASTVQAAEAVGLKPEVAGAAEAASPIGMKIDGFKLLDYRGKDHSLADYADHQVLVVAFLGVECPLVKLYAPRLQEIANRFADQGVAVIGINSNRQDPPTKIGAFAQRSGVEFPILKDPDNAVADQFHAIRTPEIFVLDRDRVVRYWGRVDDQYGFTTGVGYGKKEITREDLIVALEEVLAGKPVSVAVTPAPGCHIGRVPKVSPHGDVTFSNQIVRIINNRCVQCHREGQIGPFAMTSYDEIVGWGEMIREVVNDNRMPPWHASPEYGHFANDPRLTEEEKSLISTWVANGMPEGDLSQMPSPPNFGEGWGIPTPDAIYYIDEQPYQVAGEGVIDYQYFVVDPGYTKDVWLKAFECRPGNYAVVHHIIAFIQEPSGKRTPVPAYVPGKDAPLPSEVNGQYVGSGDERGSGGATSARRGAQIGYAPGMPPANYKDGWGLRVPAGSKFVFQMHYTAAGTEQPDRSCLGVVFADPSTIKHEVQGGVCGTVSFAIPPNDPDYVVTAKHRIRRDTLLVGFMPHLHVRGTAFRYEAVYPDGHTEILLDVPRYDFNWQLWYEPKEPVLLPKGSKLICTAHYDNSEDNVYNPDPSAEVVFGEQTWDEMMFGWYVWIDPHDNPQDRAQGLAGATEPDQAQEIAVDEATEGSGD